MRNIKQGTGFAYPYLLRMQMLKFFKGRIKTIETCDMTLVQFNIPLISSIETKSPRRTMQEKKKQGH